MIKLIGLVKQHRRLSEADELPMDPSVEDASIINKDDILQRLSNIVQELEDIDDELMNALIGLAELSDVRFKNLWETYERYLSNIHQQKLKEKEECQNISLTSRLMDY